MTDFNSYMGNIDTDFFRELCLRNGELRYYKRNEFILREGEVGSFFGFIVSGVIKYTCINQTENKTYNVGFSFANELSQREYLFTSWFRISSLIGYAPLYS